MRIIIVVHVLAIITYDYLNNTHNNDMGSNV